MATPPTQIQRPPPDPMQVRAGGLFSSLKPKDVTEEEWTCWMLEYGTSAAGADRREFNLWWISKVKSDILKKLVRPTETVKTIRRVGKYRRKPGLSLSHRRPDLESSIGDYGGLFFETSFGYHRKFIPTPGRKFAQVGQVIVAWYLDADLMRTEMKCGAQKYSGAAFYNSLAAVYSVIENAEARGDKVTLLAHPRAYEEKMKESTDVDYSKHTREWDAVLHDADGKAIYHYNPFGMVYTVTVVDEHASENLVGGATLAQALAKMPSAHAQFWRNALNPKVIRNAPGLGAAAADLADEVQRRTGTRPRVAGITSDSTPISDALFFQESREYENIKELLLATAPTFDIDWANVFRIIAPAVDSFTRMSHDRRGTFIFIGGSAYAGQFHALRNWLKAVDRAMDIVFLDMGRYDLTEFFRHPEMASDLGRPLVKYVHVGDKTDELTERLIRAIGGQIDGVEL